MQKAKRPVYNEPQKLAFIQETITSENLAASAVTLFRGTAQYEFRKGADISTFHAEELTEVLDNVCGMRIRSRYTKKNILQKYLAWCVDTGKPGAVNEIGLVVEVGDAQIRSKLVRSPAHLQVCLDRVFEPVENETQENTFRFFFWMAYGGMPEEQITKLTADDVHFEYLEVVRGDDVAVLYRQGVPAIRSCMNATQFLYRNPAYTNRGDIYRDRVPGDELIRGIRGTSSLYNFRAQLSRKLIQKRNAGIRTEELSYSRVWLSGTFYRILEAEQAGIRPDFYSLAMTSQNGIKALRSGTETEKRNTLDSIAFGFRTDYERWKKIL